MKTLGLIGGMSWESTALYYRWLNEGAKARLGGLHSARILLWSVDFAGVAAKQADGDWDGLALEMADAARRLHAAGAEGLVLCTNTMHRVAPAIEAAVPVPLLHIADVTAKAARAAGVTRPALLATRFTMEQDFYLGRLHARHGLDALVPDAAGRDAVHRVIHDELCRGIVRPESKRLCLEQVEALRRRGADGLILGCTEVGLLLSQTDTELPVFDSAALHARAALDFALDGR